MPKLTMAARIRRLEEHQRTRTSEGIRIEALEAENDERFLEQLDQNEPMRPIEDLWKALGLEDRAARRLEKK
jgi:hypothetical protein